MTSIEHWTTIVLIAIGIFATVPVGLGVLGVAPVGGWRLFFAAAIVSSASMLVPSGPITAILATPWLIIATATACQVLSANVVDRELTHGNRRFETILVLLALGWWANAALWLVAHRAGLEPLGFDRSITLLTVGHFHHAGFGLTTLMLAMYRRLPNRTATMTIAVIDQIGMLTVAAGITFSDHLEVVGATTITIALAGWARMAIGPLRRTAEHRLGRALFVTSAVAWILPMGLAIGWALGPFVADPIVRTFQVMLQFHAAINAIGLVLAGLVAFHLTERCFTSNDPQRSLTTATFTSTRKTREDALAIQTNG